MPGTFSKANRPKLAGSYFNFEQRLADPVPSSPGTAVALIGRHDWGPIGEPVRFPDWQTMQAVIGDSDDTETYLGGRSCFLGEGGYGGRQGAGEIVYVRVAGSAAAEATQTIQNTTPANALTLTAKYKGTAGNDISTEITDASTGIDRLRILFKGVEVERYDYAETNITALAADITARSEWVVPSGVTSGVVLDKTDDGALTGGDDGTTVADSDYEDAFAALEVEPFAVAVIANMVDDDVIALFAAWIQELNQAGKRFFGVIGGDDTTDTMTDAVTRSTTVSWPDIVNVGGFELYDETNGADGEEIEITSAQFAPCVAGALAARGEYASLVNARFPHVRIKRGPTNAEQVQAHDGGVVTVARDSNAEAQVYLVTGMTTWTETSADADESRPYRTFRQTKYVRTMHGIETDLTEDAQGRIGTGSVDDNARIAAVGAAKTILSAREQAGVIQPGWTVGVDQNPPPTDEDEFIALSLTCRFGRSLDQVFWTAKVS